MKKVNIKDIEIDQQNDGVDTRMSLYNIQKYDRANFRTITANTIVELEITNNRKSNLIINSIGLGVIQSNELIKIFTPKKHSEKKEIAKGEKATYFFHAYEIKLIFGRYKREEGIFLINTPKDDNYFYSSKISGDKLEQMISEMEDDDIGYNWGSSEITRLNQEKNYDSITGKLTYDYSNHYSELDIDSIDDSLQINLAIFNDRIIDSKNHEVKSKTILELSIQNTNQIEIEILSPILLVKDLNADNQKVKGYVSSELEELFPKEIKENEEVRILYDSESVDRLISETEGEEIIFLIKDIYGTQYHTNKFKGDRLEEIIDAHNINSTTVSKKKLYEFDKKVFPA